MRQGGRERELYTYIHIYSMCVERRKKRGEGGEGEGSIRYTHTHAHAHTRTHTHIYIYIYMYTHAQAYTYGIDTLKCQYSPGMSDPRLRYGEMFYQLIKPAREPLMNCNGGNHLMFARIHARHTCRCSKER